MSKQIQFVQITPEELQNAIINGINSQLEELKLHMQPIQTKTYLTRLEVSKMLNVSYVTLNKWHKSGQLKSVGLGGRVLYRQEDIDNAITEI